MMNPAPQTPHFVRPEKRYSGRFAEASVPAVRIDVPRARLPFLRRGPQLVRARSGAPGRSFTIHSADGFIRDTRLPVSGFFT